MKADPAGPQSTRKCPCKAADIVRVEVGVAEPECAVGWPAPRHNWPGSNAVTAEAAGRQVKSTVLRQAVVALRDSLRPQVAAARVAAASALRAVPVADEARIVVKMLAAEAVEVAAVPTGMVAVLRAVPGAAEDVVTLAAGVKVAHGTQVVETEAVMAVLPPAIPVVVADKVGQEVRARVAVKILAAEPAEVVVVVRRAR